MSARAPSSNRLTPAGGLGCGGGGARGLCDRLLGVRLNGADVQGLLLPLLRDRGLPGQAGGCRRWRRVRSLLSLYLLLLSERSFSAVLRRSWYFFFVERCFASAAITTLPVLLRSISSSRPSLPVTFSFFPF